MLASLAFVMPRANAATPAFKKGVNIDNWLSQNDETMTYGAAWFTEEDVAWIAAQGFDHIRFPIDSRIWLKADGSLDETKVAPFETALVWAKKYGLGAVLDIHFIDGADFNSGAASDVRVFTNPALMDKAANLWRTLATRYAKEGNYLRFEILNEPKADKNEQLNVYNFKMLAAIRESNPTRVVYFPVNKWNTIPNVVDLELPANDPNVAVTVHFYEPMIVTHQRAPWVFSPEVVKKLPPVSFPGKVPDLSAALEPNSPNLADSGRELTVEKDIDAMFEKLAAWSKTKGAGREIWLGEFGAYKLVEAQTAINWTRAVRKACDRHGFSWAVWGYRSDFPVRNKDGSSAPMLKGLMED